MKAFLWLLAASQVSPVLRAQPPGDHPPARIRYIPALAYGPKIWSMVRLINLSATVRPVQVDVYRENGEGLLMGRNFEVQPNASVEVRIDGKVETDEPCWARIAEPGEDVSAAGLEVHAFVEILEGNAIEDQPRVAHMASPDHRWVGQAAALEGKDVYFLNVADRPTVVTFCAARDTRQNACETKGNPSAHFLVHPNQAVSVKIGKLRRRFFVTESSAPGGAILALFGDGPGDRHVFSSKSTIQFEE